MPRFVKLGLIWRKEESDL